MAIEFDCNECGKDYKVDDKYMGRSIACKECGAALTVPKRSRPSAPKSSAPSSDTPRRREPSRGSAPPPLLKGNPRRKKKNRDSSNGGGSAQGLFTPKVIAMIAVPTVLVLGGIGYGVSQMYSSDGDGGGAGAQAAAPVKMVEYRSEHGGFSADYPEGWSEEGGGGTGGVPPYAKFKTGEALFEIRANRRGSAVSAGVPMDTGEEIPEELEPVAQMHDFQKQKFKADYNDYEETPAKKIEIPFGNARISTFTGDEGLLGSKIKAYRVTLLGHNHQFNVTAKCPEKQWDEYEPMFMKMINSIGR